jgi:hypothetical protein
MKLALRDRISARKGHFTTVAQIVGRISGERKRNAGKKERNPKDEKT